MKNVLVMTLFMLATLAWVSAQQPGGAPQQNSEQTSKAPVTEGCLGGSAPNYTITDNTGAENRLDDVDGSRFVSKPENDSGVFARACAVAEDCWT